MLYIVGTAIGNAEDTTLRATLILISADIILCEDTRAFSNYYQRLQQVFQIKPTRQQKLISLYKDNEFNRLPQIISYIDEGKDVVLVSESGMPTISDPGHVLINQLIKAKVAFTVVPGPTAFVNAVVLSGFPSEKILFLGFLPKKISQVSHCIDTMIQIVKICPKISFVFYESPRRINKTLKIINQLIPNADICICREMTKKFEEVIRGKAKDLINKKYKGEITLILKLVN